MIKLLAILMVLAALPISALAFETTTSNPAAIDCSWKQEDNIYKAPTQITQTTTASSDNTLIAQ